MALTPSDQWPGQELSKERFERDNEFVLYRVIHNDEDGYKLEAKDEEDWDLGGPKDENEDWDIDEENYGLKQMSHCGAICLGVRSIEHPDILAKTSICGKWNLEFGSNTTEKFEISWGGAEWNLKKLSGNFLWRAVLFL